MTDGLNVWPLLVFAAAAAWIYLPFMPAVCEFLEMQDCAPVWVPPDSDVDIRHHAKGYRARLTKHPLADSIALCRRDGHAQGGRLADETSYVVVPGMNTTAVPSGSPEPCETMIVSVGALSLTPAGVYLGEVYAEGAIHGGDRCAFRALLSDDRIELGAGSRSLRWIDAARVIRAGERCTLHGRVSSGERIELAAGCRFERMWAPCIAVGSAADMAVPPPRADQRRLDAADVSAAVDIAAGRWLFQQTVELPADTLVAADVIVTGKTRLGAGARIRGSVKSEEDLHLCAGVVVEGSVVSGRHLYVERGCHIHGPVLAEGDVWIEPGCGIGHTDHPTTLSARRVWIAPGNTLHGAVWAHEGGVVSDVQFVADASPGRDVRPGEPPEPRAAHVTTTGWGTAHAFDAMTAPGQEAEPLVSDSAALSQQLEFERQSGFKGSFISKQRALLVSPLDRSKLAEALGLMIAGFGLWYLLLPALSWFWGVAMEAITSTLGLASVTSGVESSTLGPFLRFDVPVLYVPAGLPALWTWQLGVALCAVLIAISQVLPRQYLPLAYFLRLVALVQGLSQMFFAFWPNAFPYTATGYIHTMLMASLFLAGLIPLILTLIYYLHDFSPRTKIAFTGIVMGHLVVMIPLQYSVHAFVLSHLSLLFLPLLFFVFSLPLNVMVFVALYGWGLSWPTPLRDQAVQSRVRVR
jgi:hypothetical protein